jgi:hypothetical protein
MIIRRVPTTQDPEIAHKSIVRSLNAVNSLNFESISPYDVRYATFPIILTWARN